MSLMRYAMVRGHNITADKVAPYLPSNYRVLGAAKHRISAHEPHCPVPRAAACGESAPCLCVAGLVDDVIVIAGRDNHGWTLDKYVIPRLGSGMMRADEIDLSHPVMKQISIES